MNVLLWLMCFLGAHEPCPTCKGKGSYLEYRIVYEVHEPEWCKCHRCAGIGWRNDK